MGRDMFEKERIDLNGVIMQHRDEIIKNLSWIEKLEKEINYLKLTKEKQSQEIRSTKT